MQEKLTVYDEIVFSQSSKRLNKTICGSVAFKIRSPNFSTWKGKTNNLLPQKMKNVIIFTFMHAWNGNISSLPLITMLGKSSKWTSKGSNIALRVTIICRGCSSTGNERIKAATSSAVFHLANWPRRFWPAQTDVWIIFKNNWPVRGLKIKIAPLIGLVVKFPSNVWKNDLNSKQF